MCLGWQGIVFDCCRAPPPPPPARPGRRSHSTHHPTHRLANSALSHADDKRQSLREPKRTSLPIREVCSSVDVGPSTEPTCIVQIDDMTAEEKDNAAHLPDNARPAGGQRRDLQRAGPAARFHLTQKPELGARATGEPPRPGGSAIRLGIGGKIPC